MNEGFFHSPSTSQTPKRKAFSEVEEIKQDSKITCGNSNSLSPIFTVKKIKQKFFFLF